MICLVCSNLLPKHSVTLRKSGMNNSHPTDSREGIKPPVTAQDAKAEFTLSFSRAVQASERLAASRATGAGGFPELDKFGESWSVFFGTGTKKTKGRIKRKRIYFQ